MARAELEEQSLAALRIQSVWRMYLARRYYQSVRDWIISIQSHARGYLARKRFVSKITNKISGSESVLYDFFW